MSETYSTLVFRLRISTLTEVVMDRDVMELCEKILDRSATEVELKDGSTNDVEFFRFNASVGDWTVNVINGTLYLDMIIAHGESCDVDNVDVDNNDIHRYYNGAISKLEKVGLQFDEYKIKYLSYYSGATAGISEVA